MNRKKVGKDKERRCKARQRTRVSNYKIKQEINEPKPWQQYPHLKKEMGGFTFWPVCAASPKKTKWQRYSSYSFIFWLLALNWFEPKVLFVSKGSCEMTLQSYLLCLCKQRQCPYQTTEFIFGKCCDSACLKFWEHWSAVSCCSLRFVI